MMNVATIGSGVIVDRMIEAMRLDGRYNLYCVYSRTQERAKEFADKHGIQKYYTDMEEMLNDENVDGYVERYVKAVLAVPSRQTYLFCIFPRNDYDDYSTSVNKFICMLNQKIHRKLEGTDIIYLDVFDRLLQDGRLNPELTIDDLHLNGKGYSILSEALRRTLEQPLKQAPDL